jgi:peroxiredoxin
VELPRLEQLWNKYRDMGLSIVAVEAFRDREAALKFIEDEKLTFHILENLEGEGEIVYDIFKVSGFPSTFIIDPEGKVMFFHYGFSEGDEAKMEEEILELMGN